MGGYAQMSNLLGWVDMMGRDVDERRGGGQETDI
jgi:hypothetical protein